MPVRIMSGVAGMGLLVIACNLSCLALVEGVFLGGA